MDNQQNLAALVADKLLLIKAVKLQPNNPFVWASGWKSPFYCDNRKTLSYPHVRTFLKIQLARLVTEHFPNVSAIAAVATGAIPQGALVADLFNLPFVYIRNTPKDHGLENLIEGDLKAGSDVVILEDLISTGRSAINAVNAVRNFGCNVLGVVAVFTYAFPVARQMFTDARVPLVTLSHYDAVIQQALAAGYISSEDLEDLHRWRQDPANWTPLL